MDDDKRAAIERRVNDWKIAAPVLEELRRREIAQADNVQVLAQLESAFNYATKLPLRQTSGIMEMQYWFGKLREKQMNDANE